MAKHDTSGIFYLIVEKLSEILHVHFALFSIDHSCKAVKNCSLCIRTLYRLDNVRELTDTRGLDKNPVRCKFIYYLLECGGEITHEGATNASRVHFIDLYSCLG